MPDILIHLLIPFLILLLIIKKENRNHVILLLPLAALPDIDIIFQHRAFLHNFFIPLTLLFISQLYTKYKHIFLISAFYIFSHSFLDIFNGGVSIFYPIIYNTFIINFDIIMNSAREFSFLFEYGFLDYSIADSKWKEIYVINSINIGMVVLASLSYLFKRFVYSR